VKSVGIDGPTRSIARPELIKDMPDLSEIRHPLPVDIPGPQSVAVSPAVPVAVAAAVATDSRCGHRADPPASTPGRR